MVLAVGVLRRGKPLKLGLLVYLYWTKLDEYRRQRHTSTNWLGAASGRFPGRALLWEAFF